MTCCAITTARENIVIILCLPQNTNHTLQPLNVSVCFTKENMERNIEVISGQQTSGVVEGEHERLKKILSFPPIF